ncbi:acyltransferase family protein [Marinobacter sp. 1Y8]
MAGLAGIGGEPQPAVASNRKAPFRPEIQGVRAIAALLVAIYHIWLGRVSGGVDVFFVVSGFLITGALVRRIEEQGAIPFQKFWSGLLKRLLPAAVTVILATLVATVMLLPKTQWIITLKEAAAATFYVENWQLALNNVDYLAQNTSARPFQHYWALSVQGQFYLLWPLMITATVFLAHRCGQSFKTFILPVLALLFLTSLSYSVYATATNQAFAYFNTLARVWEFSMGGMLAIVLPRIRLAALARYVLGWFGLFAVVSCGVLLQVSTVFPGYAALWPTLGVIAVIVAGSGDGRFSAGHLLASRPLAYFGDISYSFYLWHWPVLVFFLAWSGLDAPTVMQGVGIMLCSAALAWLTTRFIEEPVRFSSVGRKRPSRGLLLGAACTLPAVAFMGVWAVYIVQDRSALDGIEVTLGSDEYPGALSVVVAPNSASDTAVPVEGVVPPSPRALYPNAYRLRDSVPRTYASGCHQSPYGEEAQSCEFGDPDAEYTIALVGGSHSAQWLPALMPVARDNGWRLVNYTKSACWFSDDSREWNGADNPSCLSWNKNVMQELKALKPDVVFTMGTRASGDTEDVPTGYVSQWHKLDALGIEVLAIRDNPWNAFDLSDCVDVFGRDATRCSVPRDEALAEESPAAGLADRPGNLALLDMTEYFCNEQTCFPVAGNVLVYRDLHHITAAYARTMAPVLEQKIGQALPYLLSEERSLAQQADMQEVVPSVGL